MKPATWVLLICLVVGVYVVAKIAVRLLLMFLPVCAALIIGFLVYRALNRKGGG
jgi:hypothetical protein